MAALYNLDSQGDFGTGYESDRGAAGTWGGHYRELHVDHGLLPESCLMSYGRLSSGGDICKGVYSDDIAHIAIRVESDEALRLRRRSLCEATVSAHDAAGTVLHRGERGRDAMHHIVWAFELDSDEHRATGEVDILVLSVTLCLLPVLQNTLMPAVFLRSCRYGSSEVLMSTASVVSAALELRRETSCQQSCCSYLLARGPRLGARH
jgi:hypothetical protein